MSHQNTVTENRRSLLSAHNRRPARPHVPLLERAEEKPAKKRSRESKYSTDGRFYPLGTRRAEEIETIVLDDSSDGGEDNANPPREPELDLNKSGGLESESDDDENDRAVQSLTGQSRRPVANKLRKSKSSLSLDSIPSADEQEAFIPASSLRTDITATAPKTHRLTPMGSTNVPRATGSTPKKQKLNSYVSTSSRTPSKKTDAAQRAIEALLEQQNAEREERTRISHLSSRLQKDSASAKISTSARTIRKSITSKCVISKPDTTAFPPKHTSRAAPERTTLLSTSHQSPSASNPEISLSARRSVAFLPEDSSVPLLNLAEIQKHDRAAADRQVFFEYRARRFDFPRDSPLKNFSPFASAADEMEGVSSKDVCAVCGSGDAEFWCKRCPLAFHLKCLDPRMKDLNPEPQFCKACKAVKGDDRTLSYKPQVAPRALPARIMGFYRLASDSAQGNPMDFVLHPSIHKMFVDQYKTDWLRCWRCDRIRFVNLRTLSEVVRVPFECADAFWVARSEEKSCTADLSLRENSLSTQADKLVKLRSKRRVRLFYSGFGEKNRTLFGFHSIDEVILLDDDGVDNLPKTLNSKQVPAPLNDVDKALMSGVECKPRIPHTAAALAMNQIPLQSGSATNTDAQATSIEQGQKNLNDATNGSRPTSAPKEDLTTKPKVTHRVSTTSSTNPSNQSVLSVANRDTSQSTPVNCQPLSNLAAHAKEIRASESRANTVGTNVQPIQELATSLRPVTSHVPTANMVATLSANQPLKTKAGDLLAGSSSAQHYNRIVDKGGLQWKNVAEVARTAVPVVMHPVSSIPPTRPISISTVTPPINSTAPSDPRTEVQRPSPIPTGARSSSLTDSHGNAPANSLGGIISLAPLNPPQRRTMHTNMNVKCQGQQMSSIVQPSGMIPNVSNSSVRPNQSQILVSQVNPPRRPSPNNTWNLQANGNIGQDAQNSEALRNSILNRIGEFGPLGPLEDDILVDLAMTGNTQLYQLYKSFGRNPERFARQAIRLAKAIVQSRSAQNGPLLPSQNLQTTSSLPSTPSIPQTTGMFTQQVSAIINGATRPQPLLAASSLPLSTAALQGSIPRQVRCMLTPQQKIQTYEDFRRIRIIQIRDCVRLEQVMLADIEKASNVDVLRTHSRHTVAKKQMAEAHTNQIRNLFSNIRPSASPNPGQY